VIDVQPNRGLRPLLIAMTVLLVVGWGFRRTVQTFDFLHGSSGNPTVLLLALTLVVFAWQLLLAWRERPFTVDELEQQRLKRLRVALNIPCYNESPELLEQALDSIFKQSRLPDVVELVDDGSRVDYTDVRARMLACVPDGVEFSWVRTENRGKRHAQMQTFAGSDADIFITVDSDTILHRDAIEEGLKPFADGRVTSVCGLVLAPNKYENLLTRVEDLVTTTWQLTLRSAYSKLSSVTVNSGPFALYRAEVVRAGADGYLNETIAGRPVQFSDDSLLTLYALLAGRTVQQPSAIAFSAWPDKLSHHWRQQVRWTRGSFIRSLWRFRYLPMRGPAFWLHLLGQAQFLASNLMIAFVLAARPDSLVPKIVPMLILSLELSYATTLRTLTIRRSDETLLRQLGVYALSPLAALWAIFVYRPLRLYGMLTCLRTDWGTRSAGVEVAGSVPDGAPFSIGTDLVARAA
jgi:hyaluronan synthase